MVNFETWLSLYMETHNLEPLDLDRSLRLTLKELYDKAREA